MPHTGTVPQQPGLVYATPKTFRPRPLADDDCREMPALVIRS